MHKACAFAVALLLTTAARPLAEAAPSGNKKLAKRLFEKGELFYQQGDFPKALSYYKRAHKTLQHPAFIFNIAQCHRQLKHWTKALFSYRLFLSERPSAPNRVEVLRRIQDMAAKVAAQDALSKQVGRVSIITTPGGAAVRVDKFSGPAAGTTPVILSLSAGAHLVLIHKPGYEKMHKTVTVKSGGIAMITVTLKPLVAPRRVEPRRVEPGGVAPRRALAPDPGTTPAPASRAYKPFWKRWWFWSGVAVSAVAVGLGSIAGTIALTEVDKYLTEGNVESYNAAKDTARIADAMLLSGAVVAIATTIGAVIIHGRYKKKIRERANPVTVTPSCGARGCGVFVYGRF